MIEQDAAEMARSSAGPSRLAPGALPERRTWVPTPGCRIIACVDVEPIGAEAATTPARDALWHLAVRRMEHCVRPGDWICMLGGSRFAVCFGNGAHRIPASALGRRLARAMGDHLSVGSTSTTLDVAVGIGVAVDDLQPEAITGAAIASIRSARHHRHRSTGSPRPFVAVSRLPGAAGSAAAPGATTPIWSGDHPRFVRRVLVPLVEDARDAVAERGTPISPSLRHADGAWSSRQAGMRVLVIDPGAAPNITRLGASAIAAMARRVGAVPTVSIAATNKAIMVDHYLAQPDVVVVVLHPEPQEPARDRGKDPWEETARLVRSLREAGSVVLAVSVGASAMAVAACVEEGATGVGDLESLPHELATLAGRRALSDDQPLRADRGFDPYECLADLTPAERRVLDQMMRGRTATEIAAVQVVALSTVRTHIRSILRKLHVTSQLAAVAIAHGSIPLESSSSA